MKVYLKSRQFQMNDEEYNEALKMAKQATPCGVYALVFPEYTEITCDVMSKTQTKKAKRYYKQHGIKALTTGIGGK